MSTAPANDSALSEAQRLLDELVLAPECAKGEVPRVAREALVLRAVDAQELARRLGNLMKAIGAKGKPAS